jgi:WD40 repeat protein
MYAPSEICFSPDGKYLASSSGDQIIMIYNIKKLSEKPTIISENSRFGAGALAFSRDGSVLATSCTGDCVRIWDTKNF